MHELPDGPVFTELVFSDWIFGTGPFYTAGHFDELLGRPDKLQINAVAGAATGAPGLTVQIEMGGDGRTFSPKNGSAEIFRVSLSSTTTNSILGADNGTAPSAGFVRLAITLSGGGCYLKLYLTGRSR